MKIKIYIIAKGSVELLLFLINIFQKNLFLLIKKLITKVIINLYTNYLINWLYFKNNNKTFIFFK